MHQNSEYCKNCGQHLLLNQNFCHSCGQKADTHRINFHFLVHEIQHSIFHVDGGILYTLKHLFTRPGHMLREYLEGKRIHHFKPVLMLIIIGSINGLLGLIFEGKSKSTAATSEQVIEKLNNDPETKGINNALDISSFFEYCVSIINWFASHIAFLVLLLIPAVALGFYFGFRKYKINYAEWLIVMTYFGAITLAIDFPFFILENIFNLNLSGLYFIILFCFSFWIMLQFFNTKTKYKVILRTLWSQFLVFIFTSLLLILTTVIILTVGIGIYGNLDGFKKLNTEISTQ